MSVDDLIAFHEKAAATLRGDQEPDGPLREDSETLAFAARAAQLKTKLGAAFFYGQPTAGLVAELQALETAWLDMLTADYGQPPEDAEDAEL